MIKKLLHKSLKWVSKKYVMLQFNHFTYFRKLPLSLLFIITIKNICIGQSAERSQVKVQRSLTGLCNSILWTTVRKTKRKLSRL